MNLTLEERTKIFDKVCRLVETKHFNPAMNGVDWNALAQSRRDQILACAEPEAFEKEVQRLVAELKTSHTGFRHTGMRNIPARHAINATMQRIAVNGSERWMFQDVHQGGPAYSAGIRPGDLLLERGGREIRPPEDLTFSVGETADLTVEKLNGGQERLRLQLLVPKSKKHPVTAPDPVHAEKITDEIGLLKVAMFPGVVGIDVAKDIDDGIALLDGCSRLIVDLRGNTGGGLGQRRFHGRVVLLVNEHTASAGEMVSAFAEENNLATIVGTKTPGRLLSGSAYKVGHGYILGLPVAAYLTWQGRMLESNGLVPKFSIELSREELKQGRDTQLETAIEVARAL